jgi:hypothetical protein
MQMTPAWVWGPARERDSPGFELLRQDLAEARSMLAHFARIDKFRAEFLVVTLFVTELV